MAHKMISGGARRLVMSLAVAALLYTAGSLLLHGAHSPAPSAAAAELPPAPRAASFIPVVPGELVFGTSPHLDQAALGALAQRHGVRVEHWLPRLGLALVSYPASRPEQAAALTAALAADPLVDFVTEHRLLAQAADTPLDEYWDQQWGLAQAAGPAAWDLAWSDPSVVIAVLDTGVILTHWDLNNQLWRNPGESSLDPRTGARTCTAQISFNGVDDDGNGYVDDCQGYDFVADDAYPEDEHGHGTFVAGIAAASTNNLDPFQTKYAGVAGMGRQAHFMALRVLDAQGRGSAFNIAQAIEYAVRHGAGIINLSLTFPPSTPSTSPDVETVRRAVEAAQAADVLLVAASGNENYPAVSFPARFNNILAVGASSRDDSRASFSNYGERLDLVAPGVESFSTVWQFDMSTGDYYGYYRGSVSASRGTSFAAPAVAGTAALVRGLRPDLTQADVYELVRRAADDVGELGWDIYTGWGRLNAARAVSEALTGLRLDLAADPGWVLAGQQLPLKVSITAPSGAAAGLGARVAFSSSPGLRLRAAPASQVIPAIVTVGSGGEAEALFAAGEITGAVRITAALGALSASTLITVTPGTPGEPVSMTLAAVPDHIAAGGEAARIQAAVWDSMGAPVRDGIPVTFTTDLGGLAAAGDPAGITSTLMVVNTAGGMAEVALVSGQTSGVAHVAVKAGAGLAQALPVQIHPGPAARLTVHAAPAWGYAGDRVMLSAQTADQYGNPVADGVLVTFAVSGGQLDHETVATQDGVAVAWVTLPDQLGRVQVQAASGAAVGLTEVAVMSATYWPLIRV